MARKEWINYGRAQTHTDKTIFNQSMLITVFLLVLLYFTAIFWGGAHLWTQSILLLALFFFAPVSLWVQGFRKKQNGRVPVSIILEPVSLMALLFLFWSALSLVPLSSEILKTLSPKTARIWETTAWVGGAFPHPLSLYPNMTVNSIIFGLGALCFYGLALYGKGNRQQIHGLINGILILGTLESLYALVQIATAQPYVLWWRKDVSEAMATGSFIYTNQFACFLAMTICLGVGYLWTISREPGEGGSFGKPSRTQRTIAGLGSLGFKGGLLLLGLAIMIAALLASASRGGAVTLPAGLIFMAGLLGTRFIKSKKMVLLLLCLAVVCTYVGYVGLDRVAERFRYFSSGFQGRLALYKATYRMGQDYPFGGIGLGGFEFVFPAYQEQSLEVLVDYAHNDWAQLFAETGLVGLSLVVGGFLWVMVRSIMAWRERRDPFSVGIGLGGLGSMVTVSLHCLSDFNLHLPANMLLLALIIALTTLALHSRKEHHNREVFSGPRYTLNLPVWIFCLLMIPVTMGAGFLIVRTFQVWQADSMARTVWNSTLPFKQPSNDELIQAWSLAPGNAAYWAWMAQRVRRMPPVAVEQVRRKLGKPTEDLDVYLLEEGIKCNPTAWALWRTLGWNALAKGDNHPVKYLPLARKASLQGAQLRPYDPQGFLEAGMIELAVQTNLKEQGDKKLWREPLKQALALNPLLSAKVIDQLILYLGNKGAKELKPLLPQDPRSYLVAAIYLINNGIFTEGLTYLLDGEQLREREIERLEKEISVGKDLSSEELNKLVTEILLLDPLHPGALMAKGRILEALRMQDRRTGKLSDLARPKNMIPYLIEQGEKTKGTNPEINYFIGRLMEEEGDRFGARKYYRRALEANPQYFSGRVHLEKVLGFGKGSELERFEREELKKKIRFVAMTLIVEDAWTPDGTYSWYTQWKAPYRNAASQEKMGLSFSGESGGVWKLMLDGRFVAAWTGGKYVGEKKMKIPEGEHVFRLMAYNIHEKKEGDKLPFRLSIHFE